MSEQLPNQHNALRKAALIAGLATAAMVGGGELAQPAEAIPSLRNVTELPGYKLDTKVATSAEKASLEAASVALKSRYISDANYPLEFAGTATAIKFKGQSPNKRYFWASNRAIGVGPESGSLKLPGNPLKSANYITVLGKEFGLVDPNAGGDVMPQTAFARATGISVNTNGSDVALIQAESTGEIEQTGMRLSDVPAITYKGMAKAKPGQRMAVHGISGKGSTTAYGRLLGTTQFKNAETGITQTIDIIGVKAQSLEADPFAEADGSIAIAKNANTGPLTFSVSLGYPSSPSRAGEVTPDAEQFVHALEQDLELKIAGKYNSIGAFTRVSPQAMQAGLDNPVEQYGVQGS